MKLCTVKKVIHEFRGEYRFLSNFVPVEVEFEGMKFSSVEHAYVAAKTTNPVTRAYIQTIETPGEVKRYGRTLELREDWEDVRLEVMEGLLRQKFSKQPFKDLLRLTGDAYIVEGNVWHDNFWGSCRCENCGVNKGENHLGRLLMEIRGEIDE
jgi:ribA/ribD-fused uncharacterized protein